MKILLVDDDTDDIDIFIEALKIVDGSISLVVSKDGRHCLELLKNMRPDIIFLDINMPKMNGKECLKIIRSNSSFDKTPIIMYSTSINSVDIRYFEGLKANYLTKFADFNLLVGMLTEIIKSQTPWANELL